MPELVDRRARDILFHAYWSSKGWKVPREEPSPEDLAYAKSAGLMFDPETVTHDGAVKRILAAREGADPATLAGDFVASLSRRIVHLRPALGSYHATEPFGVHRFQGSTLCRVCGQLPSWEHDFGATSFARHKWGALPRMFPVDHAFLLERAAAEPRGHADAKDQEILQAMLGVASSMPPGAKARDLEVAWQPLLPSTRQERDELIEVLVACGVLVPSRTSPQDVRRVPLRSNWTDAAALWRGDDGVNPGRAQALFGWHR